LEDSFLFVLTKISLNAERYGFELNFAADFLRHSHEKILQSSITNIHPASRILHPASHISQ